MQGYLYIENELSKQRFQSYYFILFPYCGLRWFREEPLEKNITKLLLSANDGGWIFGGNIRVCYVGSEVPITHNIMIDKPLYPFIVELISQDKSYRLRLGCDEDDIRQIWMDEILKALHIQHYLYSCIECGAVPSKSIFHAALADQSSIVLENIKMTIPSLGSLVMVCKLNESNGTVLRAVHFENAQITDHHVPLLSSLLTFTPQLQSLSLTSNYITCGGVVELSAMLPNCSQMVLLDLSSNYIGDTGITALAKSLASLSNLTHLDLSRNRLTSESARSLAFHIGAPGTKLASLNLSYNTIGNAAASLACLLITNEPTCIENINLSYCGIESKGFKELAHSLVGCKSLHSLFVIGNFADDTSISLLMDAMTHHQNKFGIGAVVDRQTSDFSRTMQNPNKSALSVHLGGLLMEHTPVTIGHRTMRMAMAYATPYSSVPRLSLYRRIASTSVSVDTSSISLYDASARAPEIPDQQEDDSTKHQVKNVNLVCIRAQLMPYMESVHDIMEGLAKVLRADPRQLQMLSASDVDEIDSCFIMFSAMDPTPAQQEAFIRHIQINQKLSFQARPAFTSSKNRTVERSSSTFQQLPSGERIVQMLQELSRVSSPMLRKLGLRTVYIQRGDALVKTGGLASFSCHIKGGGSGGDGILGEYIPPLFPMAAVLDNVDDNNLDDEEDSKRDNDRSPVERSRSNAVGEEDSAAVVPEEAEDMWYDEDDEDIDDEWNERLELSRNDTAEEAESIVYTQGSIDETTENIDSKLILAIRQLQHDSRIPIQSGQFWQQAFVGTGDDMNEVLEDAIDDDGIFHNVGVRRHICDAMLNRDMEDVESFVDHVKQNQIPGGLALQLADQLLSEIMGLVKDAENLEAMATAPGDVNIVEAFLMDCGRLGYSGPETLMAVELREYLVRWALQEDPDYTHELEGIKQRSYISNTMISRDLSALSSAIASPESTRLLPKSQRQVAQKLLEDCNAVKNRLIDALDSGVLEELEDAFAEAAYLNYYDEHVSMVIDRIYSISSSASELLTHLLNSLREGNRAQLDSVLVEAHRVGWDHPFIHDTAHALYDTRNKIIQEEVVKSKLFAMTDDMKRGQEVKAIDAMQLLRSIKALNLHEVSALYGPIQMIEKHLKRIAGLASQEEEILRLIDERNLEKLEEVLSGRGTGRLVMSAPSADAMREWVEALELACSMGVDSSGETREVYKVGTLEKAARGKEGILRNWRQRYFVLEGLQISYYTKAGGEKKGCVRVGGGAVRIINDDTGGHSHCFELQEGRDLSHIDPELLFEARKQVKIMQKDSLDEVLAGAIAEQSEKMCAEILEKANKLDVVLDSDLIAQAKAILLRMQHRMLKVELRNACMIIPRGQLQELLRTAKRCRLDPSLPMYKTAQLLSEKPESELSILRARGCLYSLDEGAFSRALAGIQRFDVKRLGIKEKKVLVATLLQHSGMMVAQSLLFDGELMKNAARYVEQTLEGSMQYFVETEPMQLARNLIAASMRENSTRTTTGRDKSLTGGSLSPLRRTQSTFDVGGRELSARTTSSQYALEKFENLRPFETTIKKGFMGRRKTTGLDAVSILSFTSDNLQKSLLNLQKSEDELAREMFRALQVVMGDRLIQSLVGSRVLSNTSDEYALANEMVSLGISSPILRDELYIQILKQLTRNPKESSRIRGWSLLAVYLHCFPPSVGFMPYLRAFVSQAIMTECGSTPDAPRRSRVAIRDTDLEGSVVAVSRVVHYVSKALAWNECEIQAENGFRSEVSMADASLMEDILRRTPMQLEISLLTGSVYKMSICFGDINTLFSVLLTLFEKIVGCGYDSVMDLKSVSDDCQFNEPRASQTNLDRSLSTKISDSKLRADVVSKIFRGFWFYESESHATENDIHSIPVQPDEAYVIQWQHDFLWDMLQNNSKQCRRLQLRRRLLLCSEELIDHIDLFHDMAPERDIVGTTRLWTNWLQANRDLPVDHVRIDILFAEESRYVNSQLYAMTDDALAYLIALQLTLSWTENEGIRWGGGHSSVMNNVESSVRPSLRRSSYKSSRTRADIDTSPRRGSLFSESTGEGARSSILGWGKRNEVLDDENDDGKENDEEDSILWSGEPMNPANISNHELSFLYEIIASLGIQSTPELQEDILKCMSQFQLMAKQLNVSLSSPRFRYMMKSAYITYVMAWPLAGGHFAEGLFDKEGEGLVKVLICVSGNGLYLLTNDEWLLIFHAPLYDIQSCTVTSAKEYPDVSTEARLLRVVVNDMDIPLITTSAADLESLVSAFTLELLSRGFFPHGTEGGNDILDIGESFISASDTKVVMKRFTKNYPMFPTPPAPLHLEKADSYFDPPKSRRAILAEERAEEERVELEAARQAAELHAAKTMAHVEKGRQTLQKLAEDDDDDDEGIENTTRKIPTKKNRRRRTGLLNLRENSEHLRTNMISAAVCGVSSRPPLVALEIPRPPVRGVGIRSDTMFSEEILECPPLLGESLEVIPSAPGVNTSIYRPNRPPLKSAAFPLPVKWASDFSSEVIGSELDRSKFTWLRGGNLSNDSDTGEVYDPTSFYCSVSTLREHAACVGTLDASERFSVVSMNSGMNDGCDEKANSVDEYSGDDAAIEDN